jgi:NHL repeat.
MIQARLLFPALIASLLITGCTGKSAVPAADMRDSDEKASRAATTPDARDIPVIKEAFLTPMTPADNIDSPASWTNADGKRWLIATAKATDKLVVYDGQTGAHLRDVGTAGEGAGQFKRPNGIAVVDDLVFVVERDNHRVQVLSLPDFTPVLSFAAEQLQKPYGLWVNRTGEGYQVYVTDAYMAGEDAKGDDILPPLASWTGACGASRSRDMAMRWRRRPSAASVTPRPTVRCAWSSRSGAIRPMIAC